MKYVFWMAVVVAAGVAGWRILEPEITNAVFQDELRDSAAQLGWRTGVAPPNSDEEIRNLVIRKAGKHEIELDPKQVTVRHSGTGEYTTWFVAVDYTVPVNLVVYSYSLHFTPSSKGGMVGGIGVSEPTSPTSPAKALPKPNKERTDQPAQSQRTPELKKIPESLKRPQ